VAQAQALLVQGGDERRGEVQDAVLDGFKLAAQNRDRRPQFVGDVRGERLPERLLPWADSASSSKAWPSWATSSRPVIAARRSRLPARRSRAAAVSSSTGRVTRPASHSPSVEATTATTTPPASSSRFTPVRNCWSATGMLPSGVVSTKVVYDGHSACRR
jgi:hypothetical protein